jgi:hypothetical protein
MLLISSWTQFWIVRVDPKYANFAGDLAVKSNMLCNGPDSLGPRQIKQGSNLTKLFVLIFPPLNTWEREREREREGITWKYGNWSLGAISGASYIPETSKWTKYVRLFCSHSCKLSVKACAHHEKASANNCSGLKGVSAIIWPWILPFLEPRAPAW